MNVVGTASNVLNEYEPIDSGYNEEVYFMGHQVLGSRLAL